jgi:hypothetical protein
MLLSFNSLTILFAVLVGQAFPPVTPSPVPAGVAAPAASGTLAGQTQVKVRLTSMLSSHDAETGQKFSFVVDQDVLSNGTVAIARCTTGTGTITLAGKHGINGHEGNLHLRFDALTPSNGVSIPLDQTEQEFNGHQRKAMAFFTTRWINGDDVEVKTDQILTVALASNTAITPVTQAPTCPVIAPPATPAP